MKYLLPRRTSVSSPSWCAAWLVCVCGVLLLLPSAKGQLEVVAVFNQNGVSGRIEFAQENPIGPTSISVNLTGLPSISGTFPWYIYQYPYLLDAGPDPCTSAMLGGIYNSSGRETGNLAARHGSLNSDGMATVSDTVVSLSGFDSVVGRSVVIMESSVPLACANIGYPASSSEPDILYSPFRGQFAGNVYFRQFDGSSSVASVFTDLTSLSNLVDSEPGHNWHVHRDPLGVNENDCGAAGPHYNPNGANVSSQFYMDYCNPYNQTNCEVGDLSNKGAPLTVDNRVVKQFYTDTDLRLTGMDTFITGRSVVIHERNRGPARIACANVSRLHPLEAKAVFNTEVTGSIMFRQRSPFSFTEVSVSLQGLRGELGGYHVHVSPVGPAELDFPDRCGPAFTGGHWNPLSANYTAQPPATSDQYEVGDLSGKFGSLADLSSIDRTYGDPNVPLFGSFGIIGRSIVLHQNDPGGTRKYCADIVHTRPVVTFLYSVNTSSVEGSVTMSQFMDDPFSPTTIVVILRVKQPLQPPQLSSTPVAAVSSTPEMLSSTPVMLSSTPGMLSSTPEMVFSTPEMVSSTPEMVFSTPEMLSSTPEILSSTPEMLSSAPRMLSLTPGMSSTPEMVSSTPEVVSSTPEVLSSTPEMVSSTSGMVSSTPELLSSVPKLSSSTPEMSSLTTPVIVSSTILAEVLSLSPVVVSSTPSPSPTSTSMDASSSLCIESTPSVSSLRVSNDSVFLGMQVTPSTRCPQLPLINSSSLPDLSTSTAAANVAISSTSPSSLSSTEQLSAGISTSTSAATASPVATPSSSTVASLVNGAATMVPLMPASSVPAADTATSMFESFSASPSPTMAMMMRRKRSVPHARVSRQKRQAVTGSAAPFEWSLRMAPTSGQDLTDCASLLVAGGMPPNPALCSRDMPLACSSGDLTAKHGSLDLPLEQNGMFRAVFTDSNLHLTGPQSPFDPASPPPLLVQPMSGGTQPGDAACAVPVSEPPSSTSPPTTPAMSPPQATTSLVWPIVGAIVAAVVVVAVVIVVIIIIYCVRKKNSSSKYEVKRSAELEMGRKIPSKPIIGVPTYRVLHPYDPQNDGDLALKTGDWVTLEDTPYGGGWWKGSVDDRSGWFPKTYVEYVDREAEKKKKQEESFTLAAAAILDASSSFGSNTTVKRGKSDVSSMQVTKNRKAKGTQRSHTFSRGEIDSTPKMVTKFDKPYLERDDIAAMVIENITKEGSLSGGSCPNTPKSIRNNEIIANKQAEDSENSQPDNDEDNFELTKAMLEEGDLAEGVFHAEKYCARYDFTGTSSIELDFTSGSIVLVIEKADNGWWRGIHKGQLGWFPESYMNLESLGKANLFSRPTSEDTTSPPAEATRERAESAGNEVEKPKNMDETMATESGDLEASEYLAVHSYQSDAEGDLVFSEGDSVWVYWGQENGWWFGSAGGLQGWFPESYVEPIIDSATDPAAAGSEEGAGVSQDDKRMPADQGEVFPETKVEDSSLSSQLQAAVSSMKSRSSKSPSPVMGEPSSKTDMSRTQDKQEKPADELAEATAKRSSMLDIAERASTSKVSKDSTSQVEIEVPASSISVAGPEALKEMSAEAGKKDLSNDISSRTRDSALSQTEEKPVSREHTEVVPLPKEDKKVTDNIQPRAAPATGSGIHPPPSGRSRRRPPPPPGSGGAKKLLPATISEEPELSPSSQSPALGSKTSDTVPLVMPRKDKTAPPKPTSPTKTKASDVVEKAQPETQSPLLTTKKSDTAPLLKTAAPAAPSRAKGNVPRANTIAKPRQTVSGKENVVGVVKQPRRTTAVDNHTKPHRRPPPPKPTATLAPSKPKENVGGGAPMHAEVTPSSTPIPPPRAKARMKKVKRPTGRTIPPPPSIPLPPPPSATATKKAPNKPVPPTAKTRSHPLANASKVQPLSAAQPGTPKSTTTVPAPGDAASGEVKPLSSVPARVSSEGSVTPRGSPKGPRPPPPKRVSSLLPVAALGDGKKPEGPKKPKKDKVMKAATAEATNSKEDKTIEDSKVPPKRPPPPRPEQPPKQSNPPTSDPPALPAHLQNGTTAAAEAEESGSPIPARGSSLMGSLKRMVKRDSKKSPRSSRRESVGKPQRPDQPPQKRESVESPPQRPHQLPQKKVSVEPPPQRPDQPPQKKVSVGSPPQRPDPPSQMKMSVESSPQSPVSGATIAPPAVTGTAESPVPIPRTNNASKLGTPDSSIAPAPSVESNATSPVVAEPPTRPTQVPSVASSPNQTDNRSKPTPLSRSAVKEPASVVNTSSKTAESQSPAGSTESASDTKPQAPLRPARTSVSSSSSGGNTTAESRSPEATSPVETTSRRRSTNIPAKPLPPVTVTKSSVKPKPPPVAPKPSTPSPLPRTGTESFKMPTSTGSATETSELSSVAPASPNDGVSSPVNFYRATKNYNPKSGEELGLVEGDTVMFMEKRDDGFYYGMKDDGTTGLFLVSHVKPFLQ